MKRSYVITLSIQFMLVITFLVFAFIQKTETEVQRKAAQANAIEAQRQAQVAVMDHLRATQEKARADSLQQALNKILQKRK